jgi:hypothetical protein
MGSSVLQKTGITVTMRRRNAFQKELQISAGGLQFAGISKSNRILNNTCVVKLRYNWAQEKKHSQAFTAVCMGKRKLE